jgi:uncharacterized protein (DUF736 family)
MAEYDNTDRGAVFPPFPDMQMILQGKINNAANKGDEQAVLVKRATNSGKTIIEVYTKAGVLFPQEGKAEGAPEYSGEYQDRRIAAWKRTSESGKPFLSVKVEDKFANKEQVKQVAEETIENMANRAQNFDTSDFDDKIPF